MRQLTAKNLIKLRKQDFEEFCYALLAEEYRRCFAPGAVELTGPSPEDVPDGGRDLEANVLGPPRQPGHWSLLPAGRIFFSCKSQADAGEPSWRTQVVKDIDPVPVFDGRTRQLKDDAVERVTEGLQPPVELLKMLADGGSYWVLINVAGARLREFEADAAKRLSFYVHRVLGKAVDLTGRIKVKDASHLANVFNERPFALSPEQNEMLELDEPEFFSSWEGWTAELPEDRRTLHFEVDDERQGLIDALDEALCAPDDSDPVQRVFRLAGAPGVGKTRLVHHVLEQPRHAHLQVRARYAKDAEAAREWLERGGLEKSPDLVLVLDEVPADGANELWRSFARRARLPSQARLLLIGPRDDADEGKPEPLLLRPFASEQHRRALVLHDLEQAEDVAGEVSDALIGVITGLSEGYPLFSMWLTRALAKDPTLLDAPGSELTDGQDPWRATAAVLAGPRSEHGGDARAWLKEADVRAKALLLVVLVPDDPWALLEDQRTPLVDALEAGSWVELKRAATRCKERGLLRDEPAGHHYISPANLERLVLDHLFGDPSGPEPERLRRASPNGFERLSRRVVQVKASQACRQRLAGALLERLDAVRDVAGLDVGLIEITTHLDPERAARVIERIVERLGAARIVADLRLTGPIQRALAQMACRRISAAAFDAVEHALFMLAAGPADPQSTRANATWASLFQALAHQTHQSFDDRLVLLQRRLASPEPRLRVVALDGIARLIVGESNGFRPGWDDVDGDWEYPTNREVSDRQLVGWHLLVQLADDPSPEVRGKARALIADHLAAGLSRSNLGDLLDDLRGQVERWTPTERNALRDTVEWVLEPQWREAHALGDGLVEPLEGLRGALRPTDLLDRLLSQVGRRRPGRLSLVGTERIKQERDSDQELARELLQDFDTLATNISWLTSDKALRSRELVRALGFVDDEFAFLGTLMGARAEHPVDSLIVSYLCGRSDHAGAEALDPWLSEHVSDPGMTNIVARTIVAIGGSDRRSQLLATLARHEQLEERSLIGLGFWSWHEGVSLPSLDALIADLAGSSRGFCRTEALGLMARRLERSQSEIEPATASVAHSLLRVTSSDALSAVAERDWIAVATSLHAGGDPDAMRTVLSIVAGESGYLSHARAVVNRWLDEDAHRLWQVLAADYSTPDHGIALSRFARELRVVARCPHTDLLRWVGEDVERAEHIANWSAPHENTLDPVIRGLLTRFGARGLVAKALFASAIMGPTLGSFTVFEQQQLERAAHWASDPEPEVAAWASRLRDILLERAERRHQLGYG